MDNAHHLYQKRKHEGTEDSVDVHKHKKSKVAHCYYFLADTIAFIEKICLFVFNMDDQLTAAQELQNR
jgi:hypothetical protein